MAEMDIYMRRRLVALGGLVAFFIFFVLVVKSCGGDDEPETVTNTAPTGATGETGAALTPDAFIEQADAICGPANLAVSQIDPADASATQQEYQITRDELNSLEQLELAEPDPAIDKFLADLSAVVDALRAKAKAADVTAADAAQLEIDTAEVEAREQGKKAGFRDCGQFLDAGEEPTGGGGGGGNSETVAPTDTGGGIAPTDTGTVPPTDTGTAPPTDTGTAPPTDTGGDTGGGGITP
ncbi:MAG: hypothetical protein M3Y34_06420 [Actinomycetota bacterium]|nr:hypothetical protein [Actinomycetota bacterium]